MSAIWSLSGEKRTLGTSDDDGSRRSNDPPSPFEVPAFFSGTDHPPTQPLTWADCGMARSGAYNKVITKETRDLSRLYGLRSVHP
jgi:hypothetical protein